MSLQLAILCTSAVKPYYAKVTIHHSHAACDQSLWKQKQLPPCSLELSCVNLSIWRALLQKLFYHIHRS